MPACYSPSHASQSGAAETKSESASSCRPPGHCQLRHLLGQRHQDAADEVNKAGGINGKQVGLLIEDDRSDASEAATIVTKFVTQDQVHAVLGEVASSRSIAAAPIAQNAKIPMLTPSSTNPEVTKKGDYIFAVALVRAGRAIRAWREELTASAPRDGDRKNVLDRARERIMTCLPGSEQVVVTPRVPGGDQGFNDQITSIQGPNPM